MTRESQPDTPTFPRVKPHKFNSPTFVAVLTKLAKCCTSVHYRERSDVNNEGKAEEAVACINVRFGCFMFRFHDYTTFAPNRKIPTLTTSNSPPLLISSLGFHS
ncbi:hypothetical protein TcWFU_008346 [Taenia crassiceps]|uniref:Uncharacterized protein n=1 Tax=Taenia crassiceps TaxID=6207 RepID=A0ABR4QIP7_9CEST